MNMFNMIKTLEETNVPYIYAHSFPVITGRENS